MANQALDDLVASGEITGYSIDQVFVGGMTITGKDHEVCTLRFASGKVLRIEARSCAHDVDTEMDIRLA